MSSDSPTVNRFSIEDAQRRIAGLIRATPLLTVQGEAFHLAPGVTVHLKLEQTQHTGSFKARGAANALQLLRHPEAGVVAASGGNHGVAVSWAASRLGLDATVFVPRIAAPAKIERLRYFGARVRVVGEVFADALEAARAESAATGAELIHAYDDPRVMSGAGTVAAEFDAQLRREAAPSPPAGSPTPASERGRPVPRLDQVIVACGGGGLSGAACAWWGVDGPLVTIVESELTGTLAAAIEAGEPVPIQPSGLCADALGASQIGVEPWRAIRAARSHSVLVGDDEVHDAQVFLWETFRLLVEPAAATTVAYLRHLGRNGAEPRGSIGVILCGANLASPI